MSTLTIDIKETKNKVLDAFYSIVKFMDKEEVEEAIDSLRSRHFDLTDDGGRTSHEHLKKELGID